MGENIVTVERLRRIVTKDPSFIKKVLRSEIDADEVIEYVRRNHDTVQQAEHKRGAERLRALIKDIGNPEIDVLREFIHVGKEVRRIRDSRGWTANHYVAYYRGMSVDEENDDVSQHRRVCSFLCCSILAVHVHSSLGVAWILWKIETVNR